MCRIIYLDFVQLWRAVFSTVAAARDPPQGHCLRQRDGLCNEPGSGPVVRLLCSRGSFYRGKETEAASRSGIGSEEALLQVGR